MKKSLFLILAALALTSCNNGTGSSTTIPSNSSASASESSSSANVPATNAKNVLDALNKIKEEKNYQLDYTVSDTAQTDIYTKDYLYYKSQNVGIIKLKNVDKAEYPDEYVCYNFEVDDKGNIEVTGATVDQNNVPYFNPYQLDYFQLLNEKGYKVSESDFTLQADGLSLVSHNEGLTIICASLIGRGGSNSGYTGVSFKFTEQGLRFALLEQGTDSGESEADGTEAFLSSIGRAMDSSLEAYLSANNHSLSSPLSEEASSLLLSSSLHSEATLSSYDGSTTSSISSTTVDYDKDNLQATVTSSSSKQSLIYSRGEKGNVVNKYLDGSNQVAEDPYSSESFDTYVKKSKDCFKPERFRKVSDKTYRYFGYHLNNLLFAYVQVDISSYGFVSCDLTVGNDGKVSQIVAKSDIIESASSDGSTTTATYTQYVLTIKNFKTAEAFPAKTPLTPIQGRDQKLEKAFAALKKTSGNLKIHYEDDVLGTGTSYNQYTDYYYTDNLIVRDKKYAVTDSNPSTDDHEYKGYYNSSRGVAGFYLYKEDGKLTITSDADKNDTIDKHWIDKTFTRTSAVFEQDSSDPSGKTFKVREGVDDIENQVLFLDEKDRKQIEPQSVVLTLDEEGRIAKISYTYVKLMTINATLTFYYGSQDNPITVPEYVTDRLSKVTSWIKIDSWEKEGENIYATLESVFGKEFAASLPYRFTEDTAGKWHCLQSSPTTVRLYCSYQTEYYFSSYSAELLKAGFTAVQGSSNLFLDPTGKVEVRLGKDTKAGRTITKVQ